MYVDCIYYVYYDKVSALFDYNTQRKISPDLRLLSIYE